MDNKVSGDKEIWISYLDDNNKNVYGFVILIEQTSTYVKIKTNRNILTIPYHRILKIKEAIDGSDF